MKKSIFIILILMILSLVLFSCKEEKPNYNYTNFQEEKVDKKEARKVKKSKELESEEGENIEYSFWFVVWQVKGSASMVNSIIVQEHPGFSMKEFKEKHGEGNFILSFTEISYETYLLNIE